MADSCSPPSDVAMHVETKQGTLEETRLEEILKELLRQDKHGGMIYPRVTVISHVLSLAAAIPAMSKTDNFMIE